MKKIILPFILIVILGGIAYSGFKQYWAAEHPQLSGTLELTEHSVGANVPGRLEQINIEESDRVKKGELIATLDRYEQTRKDLERMKHLFESGGATEQQLEQSELAFRDQQVLSPVDGVVLVKVRETGEVLSAGSPVAVIGDDQKMWVKVFVPEGVINRVKIGQEAKLKLDGIDEVINGHVSTVATQAEFTPRNIQTAEERVTQTFAVKVMLDDNTLHPRPGVPVDVELELADIANESSRD